MPIPEHIITRKGKIVPFNEERIRVAISKAYTASGYDVSDDSTVKEIEVIMNLVINGLYDNIEIKSIQEIVERVLYDEAGDPAVAGRYIVYRAEHDKLRQKFRSEVGEEFDPCFEDDYQAALYYRTYSQFQEMFGRREHWPETVERVTDFFFNSWAGKLLTNQERQEVFDAIFKMEVMPSMRAIQFAGKAAARNHIMLYNCSFFPIEKTANLRDAMAILMSGTGAGFSVENVNVSKFPIVKELIPDHIPEVVVVPDDREGWCNSATYAWEELYEGREVVFDVSGVRPYGARLHTTGGTASGPGVLLELLETIKDVMKAAQGRRLTSYELHTIFCAVAKCVIAGNVRRSAEIDIFDSTDREMLEAKMYNIKNVDDLMGHCNNSVVYNTKPTEVEFLKNCLLGFEGSSGEPGIFNRFAVRNTMSTERLKVLGERVKTVGTNPCGEIILQPYQFCNLTTIPCRPDDTPESLARKQRISAIIGTLQSTFTDFKDISPEFKQNCDEERLLGCSLTGMFDCPAVWTCLPELRRIARETNNEFADRFGINRSTAITCVKPEGTTSEILGTSPGIHPRLFKYYIRRVRFSSTDPVLKLLKASGVKMVPEYNHDPVDPKVWVVEWPRKSPDGYDEKHYNLKPAELFEYWKKAKMEYADHNVSVTFTVSEGEAIHLIHKMWENFDILSGVTMYPRKVAYVLPPYEEIDEETYNRLKAAIPKIDYSKLALYENGVDMTERRMEFACTRDSGCM